MTDKTKVISIRVPIETYDNLKHLNLREILIDIGDNGIRGEDPDGEWVRDMAHRLNIDVKLFKKKVEGLK